ncbi:hypothetical protein [Actinospica robiniae]|uniref:hypothetical protein n=1 Tax=Actinospica robiniae TaxID=304901 RepID=UPI0003FD25C8|nr:hypothetical protein [Actinospica robiniae]
MSRLEYRALLAVDIEKSSGRGRAPLTEIRRVLRESAEASLERNAIAPGACVFGDLGDGLRIVAPPGAPKADLLTAVIRDLALRLRRHNRTVGEHSPLRIRVRAALHAGEVDVAEGDTVYGPQLEVLARLLDAGELREALRGAPADTPLALVVSGHYYEDAVRYGSLEVFPEEFEPRSIAVKEFTGQAWLFVPAFAASAPSGRETRPVQQARHVERIEQGGAVLTLKELDALAAAGATTMVTAMATDSWSAVKRLFGKVFHRAGADRARAAEQRLETDARLVEGAKDPEAARGALLAPWTGELGVLLHDHPEAAADLRKLLDERAAPAPGTGIGQINQLTVVKDNGVAMTVGQGSIYHHSIPTSPTRAEGTAVAKPDPHEEEAAGGPAGETH